MASLPFRADAADETGTWSGLLMIGALRLRLKLGIDADGKATLFSVDQSSGPLPGRVTVAPGKIEMQFPTIKASYVGQMTTADRLDGTFHQGGGSFPLTFERGEAALGPLPPIKPLETARLSELRREADSPAMAAAAMRKDSHPDRKSVV